MEILVVVIDEMARLFWILNEFLHGVPRKEFTIGFLDPPIQFAVKLTRCCLSEEMDLTRENLS